MSEPSTATLAPQAQPQPVERSAPVEPSAPAGRVARIPMLVRTARPYSLLWFVAVPMTTMTLLASNGEVHVGHLALMVIACMCGDGAYTTYNDVCDRTTDQLSQETQRTRRPVASGQLPVRWAKRQVVALSLTCATLSFVVSPAFGGLLLAGMLYGAIYSGLGVRVVGRAYVSQAYWLLLWPAMYLGVLIAQGGRWEAGVPYVIASTLFMGIGETLAKDLRDLENDLEGGRSTTPGRIGPARSATLSGIAFALAAPAYVAAALIASPGDVRAPLAVAVVNALWLNTALPAVSTLRRGYSHEAARVLHVGSIRVFLTTSLLIAVGVPV